MAYVTGNAVGGAGLDDVDPMQGADSGSTILTSQAMQLSPLYDEPVIEFSTYFFNAGGNTPANDDLVITVTDGTNQVILDNYTTASDNTGSWTNLLRFRLSDLNLDLESPITISFIATDNQPGHLVEAALDVFKVIEGNLICTEEISDYDFISIYPNPSSNFINIKSDLAEISKISLFNINGQLVYTSKKVNSIDVSTYSKGLYTLIIDTNEGKSYSSKVSVK